MAQKTHLIKIILGGYFLHIPGDENYPGRLINLANITTIDYHKDTLIAYFLDKTHMVLKGDRATLLLE